MRFWLRRRNCAQRTREHSSTESGWGLAVLRAVDRCTEWMFGRTDRVVVPRVCVQPSGRTGRTLPCAPRHRRSRAQTRTWIHVQRAVGSQRCAWFTVHGWRGITAEYIASARAARAGSRAITVVVSRAPAGAGPFTAIPLKRREHDGLGARLDPGEGIAAREKESAEIGEGNESTDASCHY